MNFFREQKIISVREFSRNFSVITKKPESKMYTIVSNGSGVGTFVPKQFEEEMLNTEKAVPAHRGAENNFEALFAMAKRGREKDITKKMDKILYGQE